MPARVDFRQPNQGTLDWFAREEFAAALQLAQRDCIPELTRVFGHQGLYLRASTALPTDLSGNMVNKLTTLTLTRRAWTGDLVGQHDVLPMMSETFSLIYAGFVLDCLQRPEPLLHELHRVLRPEGSLLLLQLNPLGLHRLRWGWSGVHYESRAKLGRQLRDAGLDVQRVRAIGPVWSRTGAETYRDDRGVLDTVRMARLWVVKRRDVGLTPLRSAPRVRAAMEVAKR